MMENFLKTKRGLEYLLETSPSDMPVTTAIQKAEDDYYTSLVEEQEAGYL
jgi:hypothetical protein